MARVVEQIRTAAGSGEKITVYGDFDVDGVAATTIMVTALRQLGAECNWFIPDRISDGYGLNPEAIREIAARGTGLVITVDCGVTSIEEVALSKDLGMGIVVTDAPLDTSGCRRLATRIGLGLARAGSVARVAWLPLRRAARTRRRSASIAPATR